MIKIYQKRTIGEYKKITDNAYRVQILNGEGREEDQQIINVKDEADPTKALTEKTGLPMAKNAPAVNSKDED